MEAMEYKDIKAVKKLREMWRILHWKLPQELYGVLARGE